jgi:putative SOS response-associated peptidase YedK
MPVMLSEEARWQWLLEDTNEKALLDMLIPYPAEEMKCYPVSKAVNTPNNDSPEVLEPLED